MNGTNVWVHELKQQNQPEATVIRERPVEGDQRLISQ